MIDIVSNVSSFYPTTLMDWGTVIASIAAFLSAVTSIFIIIQVRLTRTEMNLRLRPWLGKKENFSVKVNQVDPKGVPAYEFTMDYYNYGDIPAVNIRAATHASISDDLPPSSSLDYSSILGTLMPSETGFFAFRVADRTFHDAYTGKTPLYLTISFLYENSQSGKQCETTYILTRRAEIQDFVLVSSKIT